MLHTSHGQTSTIERIEVDREFLLELRRGLLMIAAAANEKGVRDGAIQAAKAIERCCEMSQGQVR